MKSQPDEEGAISSAADAAVEMEDMPTGSSNQGPRPLPPPAVLDASQPPRPLPQYSHLELRQLEGDGDTTHCWAGLPPGNVTVRGASYLRDGKKAPSEPASLCLAVELFRSSLPVHDVAGRADSPAHTLCTPQPMARLSNFPLSLSPCRSPVLCAWSACAPTDLRCDSPITSVLVVNLIIPATDGYYQLVLYYGVLEEEVPSAATRLYQRFCAGSDAFRNARFKLIPSIEEGPWLVKTGVGSRPSILGKTLKQRFSRGDGYVEVGVDCNSSPAAGRIVSLVKSYARSLVIDLSFVIEAQTAEELPEKVIGCTRLMHIDLAESTVPTYVEGDTV